MIYGSVCSGIEAATVAWHPLGWRPSFFSEIESFPRAVLSHHYPTVPLHGDFTTIKASDYDPIDLLVGGTPCQSFSIAGLRGGLADDRGNLALEYLRLADRLRPRWLVWENVPGVLSSNGGRDFGAILGGMVELGYGWAYRVLDAQHFGVPQRRRRVFIVGHLGDWRRAAAVLFERHSLQGNPPPRREAGQGFAHATAPSLTASGRGVERCGETRGQDPVVAVAGTLGANHGNIKAEHAWTGQLIPQAFGGNNASGPIEVATALNACASASGRMDFETETFIATTLRARAGSRGVDSDCTDTLIAHTLRGEGFDASEDGTGRGIPLVPVADTLTSHWHNSNGAKAGNNAGMINPVIHPIGVRRLTPRECERLQGFLDNYTRIPVRVFKRQPKTKHFQRYPDLYEENPDGTWTRFAADGPRYKALGNSMAVPCMAWIGQRIQQVENLQASLTAAAE